MKRDLADDSAGATYCPPGDVTPHRVIHIEAYRGRERGLSVAGEPPHYAAIVARSLSDMAEHDLGDAA